MPILEGLVHIARSTPPPNTHDLRTEISCYSLPYGGLGFVSHILTYYTLLCLSQGRKPLWPWSSMHCTELDIVLGSISLIVSTSLAITAMLKCRKTWELFVIALWKLSMSAVNGLTAIYTAARVHAENPGAYWYNTPDDLGGGALLLWIFVCAWMVSFLVPEETRWLNLFLRVDSPGMISGLAGLLSLVSKHWHMRGVFAISVLLIVLVVVGTIIGVLVRLRSHRDLKRNLYKGSMGGIAGALAALSVFAALYSDWALGVMADNLSGQPTRDNSKLYWVYFAVKRLTMFNS